MVRAAVSGVRAAVCSGQLLVDRQAITSGRQRWWWWWCVQCEGVGNGLGEAWPGVVVMGWWPWPWAWRASIIYYGQKLRHLKRNTEKRTRFKENQVLLRPWTDVAAEQYRRRVSLRLIRAIKAGTRGCAPLHRGTERGTER